LNALLDKYADEGIGTLESSEVLKLNPFREMGTPMEIIKDVFGGKEKFDSAVQELEDELYKEEKIA
jgi:type I restriction enzyme R subunit